MKKIILSSLITTITIVIAFDVDIDPYFAGLIGGKKAYHKFKAIHQAVEVCHTIYHGQRFDTKEAAYQEVDRCIEKYRPLIFARLEAE